MNTMKIAEDGKNVPTSQVYDYQFYIDPNQLEITEYIVKTTHDELTNLFKTLQKHNVHKVMLRFCSIHKGWIIYVRIRPFTVN